MEPKALERILERGRAAARKAVRDAEKIVAALATATTPSARRTRRHILKLENALVEVRKHHAVTVADERRLTALALAEPLAVQREVVEEINAAVARLRTAVENAVWNRQVYSAQGPEVGAVDKARAALVRMRASAAKAEALPTKTLGRSDVKLIARLDGEMKEVKMYVAVCIADRKRFEAAAGDAEPNYAYWTGRLRAPDTETMGRVLAAQRAAVDDLLQQLRDVNDRVAGVKRRARIEAAKRRRVE